MNRIPFLALLLGLAACSGSDYYDYSDSIHDAPISMGEPVPLGIELYQSDDLQYIAWCALESVSAGPWSDSLSDSWSDAASHEDGDSLHECYVIWRQRPAWPRDRLAGQWDSNLKN